MPDDFTLNAIVAEKVLIEGDGIPSVVRILDVVFVDPSIPPEKRPPFLVSALVMGRFRPGAERDCVVKIDLIRANGETTALVEKAVETTPSKYPDAPGGFNMHAQFGLVPQNPGTCYVSFSAGGSVVRCPLTFLLVEPAPGGADK